MIAIAYSPLDLYAEFDEQHVFSLVVESPNVFVEIISDVNRSIECDDGNLVVSDDFKPIDFHKHASIISSFVPFELNRKEIITKLHNEIKNRSINETFYHRTAECLSYIQRYIYDVTADMETPLIIDPPDDISAFLKGYGVKFNDINLSLPEKVLEYMNTSREYFGKKVFFTVNLRSYISDKQIEELFYEACLNKMILICIENKEYKKVRNEKRVIIDKDYCII